MDKTLESQLNKLKLTGIDVRDSENGFKIIEVKNKNIKKIVVPEGITRIAESGFAGYGFREIKLPSTLWEIGHNAFESCTRLEKIEIPDSLQYIATGAFYRCTKLKEIRFPRGVIKIKSWVCAECWELARVEILGNVTDVENHAFVGCAKLETIKLSNSVENIGEYAFKNAGITEFICPNSLVNIDNYAFDRCDKLEKVEFNDGLKRLKRGIFVGCFKLKDVRIPHTIKVSSNVFEDTVKVTRVNRHG